MDGIAHAPPIAERPASGRIWHLRRLWPLSCACIVAMVAAVAVPLGTAEAQTKTVVLMGDSLMAQSAWAVSTYVKPQGYAVNATAAVGGAGLLDTQVDWLVKGQQLVDRLDPSVVVVEYVGNYGVFGSVPGISYYSRAWYSDWASKAQRLEDILTSRGATVYWVLGPPVAPANNEAGIKVIDHIYEHLHAPHTASGRPPFIDVTPALTGGTGKFQEYLSGPNGTPVQVRLSDGVHFTPYGQTLFARAIANAIV